MIGQVEKFRGRFDELGWDVHVPSFQQTMSVAELCQLVPQFDGWIIGDDPANAEVVRAASQGQLKAAVKWGVGVDNVDFDAFRAAGIPVANTPGMFGNEVADIAMGYVIALARHTFEIHAGVVDGKWPKPAGISLAGKTVVLVGFGDIGRETAARLRASKMNVQVVDPGFSAEKLAESGYARADWPGSLSEADFVVFTCALTKNNRHMFDRVAVATCKPGVRVVNVARGPLIQQQALLDGLESGRIHSCALDVFEDEPLPAADPLRGFSGLVFGSHNASNTIDAVMNTSFRAIDLLKNSLAQ
jgi:D-3-phosphoglycerate dehydrogenase